MKVVIDSNILFRILISRGDILYIIFNSNINLMKNLLNISKIY